MVSLTKLRKQRASLLRKRDQEMERKKLSKEIYQLKHPKRTAFFKAAKRTVIYTGKVTGSAVSSATKSIAKSKPVKKGVVKRRGLKVEDLF